MIRLRDQARASVSGVTLPRQPEFDLPIRLTLSLALKAANPERNPYPVALLPDPGCRDLDALALSAEGFSQLPFRVVRLLLQNGQSVTLLTDLDTQQFPPDALKALCARRWGIETSIRSLKYAVGLAYLYSKMPDVLLQELFAAFIIYNLTQAVTWGVDTGYGHSKHRRHVKFSDAVALCCAFLRKPVDDLRALLARKLIPHRPGRAYHRPKIADNHISFLYRPAR